jgi:hypothetical protein
MHGEAKRHPWGGDVMVRIRSVPLAVIAVLGATTEALTAGVFYESGGLIVVEVESEPTAGDWVAETGRTGFTGTCYYRMNGNTYQSGSPNGRLVYNINIANAGTYRLRIHSNKEDVGDDTWANDCYTKMVGHPGYQGSDTKTYQSGSALTWRWRTMHEPTSGDHREPEYTLAAGQHEFNICGRSKGFMIDRFVLFNTAMVSEGDATDLSNPQSSTAPAAPGRIVLSSATYSVDETGGAATITIRRVGGSDGDASVSYATSNGSAQAGSDYTAASGTKSWSDGQVGDRTFTIPITDDGEVEGPETVNIALSNPSGAALGSPSSAVLTIVDDEDPGLLSFTAASYGVVESDGTVTLTVERTVGSDGAVSVDYATSNGTAVAGGDYVGETGTVDWGGGQLGTRTITVTIQDDAVLEPTQQFYVTLSSPTGRASLVSPSTATVVIEDDDAPGVVRLSSDSYTVTEGDSGTTQVTVTFTRAGGVRGEAVVHYSTSAGSAAAGVDYQTKSGSVTWVDGTDGDRDVTLDVIGDTALEIDETFAVTIDSVDVASRGSPATATVVVLDDELDSCAPVLDLATPGNGDPVGGVVVVAGDATDNLAVASVQISVDGGPYVTVPGVPLADSVEWSYPLATWELPNGDHDITVLVTDYRGLTDQDTVTVTVTNDIGLLGANGIGGCVPGAGGGAGALGIALFLLTTLRRRRRP